MFFNEIEEEFWQLKQKNEKLRTRKSWSKKKRLESQLKEIEQEKKKWNMESS